MRGAVGGAPSPADRRPRRSTGRRPAAVRVLNVFNGGVFGRQAGQTELDFHRLLTCAAQYPPPVPPSRALRLILTGVFAGRTTFAPRPMKFE